MRLQGSVRDTSKAGLAFLLQAQAFQEMPQRIHAVLRDMLPDAKWRFAVLGFAASIFLSIIRFNPMPIHALQPLQ